MWRVCCNSLHFPCNVWEKILFVVMYLIIKSVWVSGSDCLISYVNVVALLNIIQNKLTMTFVPLDVFVSPSIQAVNIHCGFAGSYGPSMLSLSESKLGSLEYNRVSCSVAEWLRMQPSATKSIIVICYNQYYKRWVIWGLCVTWNYYVPNNPRRQSTWSIRFWGGGLPAGALHVKHYMSYELYFGMWRS
jgi:hypothetical protein